jgi:dihydrolipoamide dehydrogenase
MANPERFDLIVIGAGPGGYVACVRAAQLGMRVACVEKTERLGGVCLNEGCIPSKALLDSSEVFALAKNRLAEHGIQAEAVTFSLERMMARKAQIVGELTDNVRRLLEGNGVEVIHGTARLVDQARVAVAPAASESTSTVILEGAAILLATGSEPLPLAGLPFDGARVIHSTQALSLDAVPSHLGIVGAGYIGLELGSLWARLGSRVTIIEMLPQIAGALDGQVARTLERILVKQGLDIRLRARVLEAEIASDGVRVRVATEGREETATFERLLVAIGRRPLTRGLGVEALGIRTDARSGRIEVDARYRTSIPTIHAIGDLIAGPMLAHKASAEGIAAVECLAGLPGEVNYGAIPAIIYTAPEVASVGLTEEQVRAQGIDHCVGTYPFAGAGRARCMGEKEGFAKIIAERKTDRILGAHILGARAAEMIAECVIALECGASSEDVARSVHGHPTFAEALQEAAKAVQKCAIYAP